MGECKKSVTRFTFEEDGFYRTLKRRVLEKYSLKEIQDESQSKVYGVILAVALFICLSLALYFHSYLLGMLCSPIMIGIIGVAHNFVHHKESPFRYLFFPTGFTHS